MALRDPNRRIVGWDASHDANELALRRNCIDEVQPLAEVCKADIVFVAVPPLLTIATLEKMRPHLGPTTVVTDTASVKAEIATWANAEKFAQLVPGHPMAGHEKAGANYASPWMFRGATWILTPARFTDRKAIKTVEEWVQATGANPVRVDAETHDEHVAILSHLPHILASALVMQADSLQNPDVGGGSWRDLTRVAGAEPDLWLQILKGNRPAVLKAIEGLQSQLQTFESALKSGDDTALLQVLQRAREAKLKQSPEPKRPITGVPAKKSGRSKNS